jgi:hypothetical protein
MPKATVDAKTPKAPPKGRKAPTHATDPAAKRSRRREPASASMDAAGRPTMITAEERYRMISEAAYYRAERRGFTGNGAIEDWLAAEASIDAMLTGDAREA